MKTYEDGLVEGRLQSLENITAAHKDRMDAHGGRLRLLERVVWAVGGVMVFIQLWPALQEVVLRGAAQ